MKYFGTVRSFDDTNGHGSISPDTGGPDLSFGLGAWNRVAPPQPGQRLSYDLHHANGEPSAANVETI
jgi:cold shock CspA family protein